MHATLTLEQKEANRFNRFRGGVQVAKSAGFELRLPPEAIEQFKAFIETYERLDENAAAANATEPMGTASSGTVVPTGTLGPQPTPTSATTIVSSSAASKPRPGTAAAIKLLKSRLEKPSELWWTDLAQAEVCVTEVLDAASLRARVSACRRRMHEVVGDARYAQYILAAPDPGTAPEDQVRADLAECIRTVYYFYSAYGLAARSRSDVTQSTFNVGLCILAIQAVVATSLAMRVLPGAWWPLPREVLHGLEYLVATSAAAVLGSVVSVQARLQDPKVDVDPLYRFVQTHSDRLSTAYVSPIFAAIFGLVIFALTASGLIGGSAFPHINSLISDSPNLSDVALVLIYGFLSGFAERLVPDALNRIATKTIASLSGGEPNTPQQSTLDASKLVVSVQSLALATNAQATFTATFVNSTDDITAASSDMTVATVTPITLKGPGPATFTVQAVNAGQATISAKCGRQSATVSVTVT